MKLTTDILELRGIKNVTSKNGNVYYNVFAETIDGEPLQFYASTSEAFPDGLKKGDHITISVDYNERFKSMTILGIHKVNKAG